MMRIRTLLPVAVSLAFAALTGLSTPSTASAVSYQPVAKTTAAVQSAVSPKAPSGKVPMTKAVGTWWTNTITMGPRTFRVQYQNAVVGGVLKTRTTGFQVTSPGVPFTAVTLYESNNTYNASKVFNYPAGTTSATVSNYTGLNYMGCAGAWGSVNMNTNPSLGFPSFVICG